jgi:hypothetical protein
MKLVIFILVFISSLANADALVSWTTPTNRVSGEKITADDLGGYEIRYRKSTETAAQEVVIIIPDGKATQYSLIGIFTASTVVTIAVFDKTGVYSDFVPVVYQPVGKPQAPTAVKVALKINDVVGACVSPNCRVAVIGEWK